MLTDKQKKFQIKNKMCHKEWGDNTSGVAELIVLLKLFTIVERRGRHIENGKLEIGFYNRRHHRNILEELRKSNAHKLEAGAEIAIIKKLMRKIKFEVVIKLIRGYNKIIGTHL